MMIQKAFCLGVLLSNQVFAVEQTNLFESGRSLGRGRTFVAAFDSDDATRLNPATLAESEATYQLRGLELEAFLGENVINTVSDIVSAYSGSGGSSFIDLLEGKFGERQYGRMQMGFISQRFGALEIAPFGVGESFFEMNNPILPELTGKFEGTFGANIAYGFKMQDIVIGVTLRPLYRWFIQGNIGFINIMDFLPQDSTVSANDYAQLVSGFGLGVDVGAIWSPSDAFRLGALVQNLGDTEYFQNYGTEPPVIQQKVSTGALWRLPVWGSWNLDLLADLQGIINRDGLNLLRLLHAGAEFGTSFFGYDNDFGITAGMNEGYFGGGFFFDLWIGRLHYANYGVETGKSPGQIPDRRITFSFSLKMTF